jgi:hypothetical protein
MFLVDLLSTTSLASASSIMEIASTSTGIQALGLINFAYTSLTAKNASSFGLLLSSTANSNITLLNSSFNLAGTSDPTNHCVGTTGAGVKTLFFGGVLTAPTTSSKIQAGIVKLPYSNLS